MQIYCVKIFFLHKSVFKYSGPLPDFFYFLSVNLETYPVLSTEIEIDFFI